MDMHHEPADQREVDARSETSDVRFVASCPRCGYSQRGAIAAWRNSCPLEGRCTECGLTFIWSEVLRPNLHEPKWCFEYARPRGLWLLPSIWPTLIRSSWPWWFWRSLKMAHPIRVPRGRRWYPAPRDLHHYLGQRLGPRRGASVDGVWRAVAGMATGVGLMVLMPLSFVLLPVSRHKAKVRWSHIARVVAYGFAISALLGSVAILLITVSLVIRSARPLVLLAAIKYTPILLVALWWVAAIRNYLKIPHAWMLTATLTVMNTLLLVAALWLVAPKLVVSAFRWSMY